MMRMRAQLTAGAQEFWERPAERQRLWEHPAKSRTTDETREMELTSEGGQISPRAQVSGISELLTSSATMTCAHTLQRAANWRQATLLSTEAPLLYVITPTRGDERGLLGLSRLGLALAVARVRCRWFIIESRGKTETQLGQDGHELPVRKALRLLLSDVTKGVNATHLIKPGSAGSRGGLQKSYGLSHVYTDWKARGQPPRALVYFADDDNWYRPAVFEHMAAWVAVVPLNATVLTTWPSAEMSELGCTSLESQPPQTHGTAAQEARRKGRGFVCTPWGTIRHFQDRRTGRRFELDWSEFAVPMWLLVPTTFTRLAWYGRRCAPRSIHSQPCRSLTKLVNAPCHGVSVCAARAHPQRRPVYAPRKELDLGQERDALPRACPLGQPLSAMQARMRRVVPVIVRARHGKQLQRHRHESARLQDEPRPSAAAV